MALSLDLRFEEAGFVMIDTREGERRMVFAPKKENNQILELNTGNWGELSTSQMSRCKEFLQQHFPNKQIVITG